MVYVKYNECSLILKAQKVKHTFSNISRKFSLDDSVRQFLEKLHRRKLASYKNSFTDCVIGAQLHMKYSQLDVCIGEMQVLLIHRRAYYIVLLLKTEI